MSSIQIPQEIPLKESASDVPSASYLKASTAHVPELPGDIRRIALQGIDELNHVLNSKHYSTPIFLAAELKQSLAGSSGSFASPNSRP